MLIRNVGLAFLLATVLGWLSGSVVSAYADPYLGDDIAFIVALVAGAYGGVVAVYKALEDYRERFY